MIIQFLECGFEQHDAGDIQMLTTVNPNMINCFEEYKICLILYANLTRR